MRIYRTLEEIHPREFQRPVATVGVFDGVHRGHQHLIAGLREWAEELADGEVVVITFNEHPQSVLGRIPPAALTSVDHRLLLLGRHGVDAAVVLTFDRELASWPPERFVEEVVIGRIGCRSVLMGPDAAFGCGAAGTAEVLREMPGLGIEVRSREPLLIDGGAVSSTEVRGAILKGELDRASRLLGRAVSIYGEVIHGDGRGGAIGFPTANLNLFHSAAPPHGVYIAHVELDGVRHDALVNIGRRPTFMRRDDPLDYSRYFNEQLDKVEIHLRGFRGDLYGRRLEAVLHRKLREERRFEGVDELVRQIRRDVEALLAWRDEARGDTERGHSNGDG
ncbi:MAG: riboflavin biosynthesis protein RibF [Planctomycetota bacterium]